jgi:hypothetical protein
MNKHFEKLVQCDHRLFCLSRQPEINLAAPFFDSRLSIFEDPSVSGSHNIASPVGAQSSSEHVSLSHDALSPSSGILFVSTILSFTFVSLYLWSYVLVYI